MSDVTASVVIVGAGPVGLTLACELGVAGVPALVVERLAEPTGQSRALGLHARSVEVLDQHGLADAMLAEGTRWPRAHFAGLPLDLEVLDGRHRYALMITQARVEALLTERAVALGAEIRRGHEVTALTQDDEKVSLRVRADGGEDTLECAHVVGCDGGGSTVRRLAGIGFPGTEPTLYAVLGDVDSVDESIDIRVPNVYPNGIFGVAPLGPGLFRVTTVEYGVTAPERGAPVTPAELAAAVRRVTGRDFALGEAVWLSRFDDSTRLADRYRADRVFLAGDAAHVHFPLSGQGMNVGIQDAVNLGWKLAAEVQEWAPPGLLDTYEAERRPVGDRVCGNTRAQSALTFPVSWAAPLRDLVGDLFTEPEVHRRLVEMVTAVDVRYPIGGADTHPLVGRRMPDAPLTGSDGPDTVFGALRSGRGVLFDLSGGGPGAARPEGWKDRVDVVTAGPVAGLDATGVLVRPDGHVAWAATAPWSAEDEELPAALRAWFGQVLDA